MTNSTHQSRSTDQKKHPQLIIALDSNNVVSFASRGFIDLILNSSSREVIGQSAQELNIQGVPDITESGRQTASSHITDKYGASIFITWHEEEASGWVGVGQYHTQDTQTEESRNLDPLTGIGNRAHFSTSFNNLQNQALSSDASIVMLALDLDNFKPVNDTLGHAVGDALLVKVVDRLKKTFRDTDSLSRIGGDEFALIVVEERGLRVATQIAERIVDVIGRPFIISGNQINIGISIGIAKAEARDAKAQDVLQQADIALYYSKGAGRSCYNWYTESMSDELQARRQLEIDLRRALLLNQFKVVFQPQLYLQDSRIYALKASLEWHHPELGNMNENDFIEVAEDIGESIEIMRWYITAACRETVSWDTDARVIVPITSAFFGEDKLTEQIETILSSVNLAPSRLELEINETVLLRNESIAAERMASLHELGIRVSLHEFGDGLLSLSYLRALPLSAIKFDRSFITNSINDKNKEKVLSKIAELGHSLGLPVFAEGAESPGQLEQLANSTSVIEGLKLFEPISSDEVVMFLSNNPPVK